MPFPSSSSHSWRVWPGALAFAAKAPGRHIAGSVYAVWRSPSLVGFKWGQKENHAFSGPYVDIAVAFAWLRSLSIARNLAMAQQADLFLRAGECHSVCKALPLSYSLIAVTPRSQSGVQDGALVVTWVV